MPGHQRRLLCATAGAACAALLAGGAAPGSARQAVSPSPPGVAALLVDNTLVLDAGNGRRSLRLGPPSAAIAVGHRLALLETHRGGRLLVALVATQRTGQLVAIRLPARHVAWRVPLPAARYSSIDVAGAAVFAFGNVVRAGGFGAPLVVEVRARHVVRHWVVPQREGAFVYRGIVDANGRYAVLSYHDSRVVGADVLALRRGEPFCIPVREPCLRVHGDVELFGGAVWGTTGDPPALRAVALDGRVLRTVGVPLARNHLMEFALDRRHGIAWPVGSCGYVGGVARVDLRRGTAERVLPPVRTPGDPLRLPGRFGCGERIALGPGGELLLAQPSLPVPQRRGAGAIAVVAGRRLVRRFETRPDPLDVIALP